MKDETFSDYKITGVDELVFLRLFESKDSLKILEVGSHDEPVANILSNLGHSVVGVDLREYNPNQDIPNSGEKPACNYTYVQHDFCDLSVDFIREHIGTFDVAVSLSAIEHFGLNTYGEGSPSPYYDIIACRQIWQLLKENGLFYLTVPFGGVHHDYYPNWRIYNKETAHHRLVQDFTVEETYAVVSGPIDINGDGKFVDVGYPLKWEQAIKYGGNIPHISLVLKMKKVPKKRFVPNK